jgi:hypothetical protein
VEDGELAQGAGIHDAIPVEQFRRTKVENGGAEECVRTAGQAPVRWVPPSLFRRIPVADAIETEYAAAFFLLADSPKDAVSVIFSSLKDPQLAITVARVYEGTDSGPVLRNLLESKVLPHAVAEGNRWLASWTFWMPRS